jgi:hypothetical protein
MIIVIVVPINLKLLGVVVEVIVRAVCVSMEQAMLKLQIIFTHRILTKQYQSN